MIYNVFDQSPEDELFPACREHGVGVIARVPLDEGGLTGTIGPDTEFSEGDFRSSYFRGDRKREVHERVRAIAGELGIAENELADVALRFVLSEPTVSAVIPGMRSVRNVERNVAASDGAGMDLSSLGGVSVTCTSIMPTSSRKSAERLPAMSCG